MSLAWKAGVATAAITPAEPMWLAGWAARRQPALRAAMELFAKAIAFEDARGERAVIVTADLIAIPRDVADAVAARVRQRWDLPRERLLFNASHTHTAPELRPDKVPFFEIPEEFARKIPRYVAELEDKLAGVIDRALAAIEPVTLRVQQSHAGFAVNRRRAGGPVDHDVPLLAVERRDGGRLAIVFGYACHNLTLPPEFCEFHGDYAGVAQQRLEADFQGATALFLAGAGADQDPSPRGSVQLAEQHGGLLANTVEQALASGGQPVRSSLGVQFEDVRIKLQPLPPAEVLAADARSTDRPRQRKALHLLEAGAKGRALATDQACPVQVLRLGGELLLIALGGEPVVDYARLFKAEFGGRTVWVAGYANDMFGYLPTRQVQQEGGYEGGRAALWSAMPMPLGETAEAQVVATVRRLVRQVGG